MITLAEINAAVHQTVPQRNPDIIAGGTRIPVETTIIGRLSGTKGHDRNTDHNYG